MISLIYSVQMLKAFTPVAVLAFSLALKLDKSSKVEFIITSFICVGVALAGIGELRFSWIGFMFQFLGILVESMRLVLTNIALKDVNLDPLSMLYYTSPVAAICIGISCSVFELRHLPWDIMLTRSFIQLMILSGMVAFTLNIAVVLLIANSSALVFTLSGVVKDVLLVFLSMVIFGSPVTWIQYFGYSIALLGLNWHRLYKKNPAESVKYIENFLNLYFYRNTTHVPGVNVLNADNKKSDIL